MMNLPNILIIHHIWRKIYMFYTSQYEDPDGLTTETAAPESIAPPGPPMPPMPLRPPLEPPSTRDTRLVNDIKEAVIREVHAYDYYTRLAAMAGNEQESQTILRIRHDEMKHYRWFTAILFRFGAEQPEIPPGELPRSFEEGIRTAIKNELDAAAFYQNIAYRARDRSIEMHFLHAAQDEQRHAAWFQYMLSELQTPYR
jgi:rubrerythrin